MFWLNPNGSLGTNKWSRELAILIVLVCVVGSQITGAQLDDDDDLDNAKTKEERERELEAESLANAYNKPILGNFASFAEDSRLRDIFRLYFKKVLALNDEALQQIKIDDPRVYRPTPKLCLYKFVMFKNDNYVLRNPIDLIPIDACLEWLFDKDPKRVAFAEAEIELLPKGKKREVKALKADGKLRSIFEATKFRKGSDMPTTVRDKIYKYLVRLLDINAGNQRSECNGLWMTAYNDFIEEDYLSDCEDDDGDGDGDEEDESRCPRFGWPEGAEDPYLRLIVESTRFAARRCYSVTNAQMYDLMVDEYENNKPSLSVLKSAAKKQMDEEKWSRYILQVLQLVTGVSKKDRVDLSETVTTLNELRRNRHETVSRFVEELGGYAIQNIDLKDTANDGQGAERYRKAMFKLCRPFIDQELFMDSLKDDDEETEKKPFEFYGLVYSLVRLTNHLEVFGITKETLESDIVIHKWQGVYLSTFACQIISTTFAELDYTIKDKPRFKITFPRDLDLEEWPLDQIAVQVTSQHRHQAVSIPSSASSYSPSSSSPLAAGDKPPAKFGLKFNNFFHKSGGGSASSNGAGESTTSDTESGEVGEKEMKVLSLDWINYWRDSHGSYPKAVSDDPTVYRSLYRGLPRDLTTPGRKLSSEELKAKYPGGVPQVYAQLPPASQAEPAAPKSNDNNNNNKQQQQQPEEPQKPSREATVAAAHQDEQRPAPVVEPASSFMAPAYQQPAMQLPPASPYNPMLMVPPTPLNPAMFPPGAPMHPAAMLAQQQQQQQQADPKGKSQKPKWSFKKLRGKKSDDDENNNTPAALPPTGYNQLMQLGAGYPGNPMGAIGYNAAVGQMGVPGGFPPMGGPQAAGYPGGAMSPAHQLGGYAPSPMGAAYGTQMGVPPSPMNNYAQPDNSYYGAYGGGRASHDREPRRRPDDYDDRDRDRDYNSDRQARRGGGGRRYDDDDDRDRDYRRPRDDRDYDDDRARGARRGRNHHDDDDADDRDDGRWSSGARRADSRSYF